MNSQDPYSMAETDPRFPSGPWLGYWLQKAVPPGKHEMELHLHFQDGVIRGDGRDWVGRFTIQGRYELSTGACRWVKQYVGRHAVDYAGYNEGRGIWGRWEIAREGLHGGFYIWPEGMPDPSLDKLREEAELPRAGDDRSQEPVPGERQAVPVACA
jgi:hypothetical protein